MVSSKHGARLAESDIQALDTASNHLAAAAAAIRRANPTWGEAVVSLLVVANETIVRVRDKGAATFVRYMEKHGLGKPQDAPAPEAAGNTELQPPSAALHDPEE